MTSGLQLTDLSDFSRGPDQCTAPCAASSQTTTMFLLIFFPKTNSEKHYQGKDSFFIFFQNNKNSLTNKDFILSIWTSIYSWRWNKRPVMSISSPLGSVPTPILPLNPPTGSTESTRAYCCVFDEVYRLLHDWWHLFLSRHHWLCIRSFYFVQNCTRLDLFI